MSNRGHKLPITESTQSRPPVTGQVERLLAAVSGGDQIAFADLYARFSRRVFGLSVNILRDRHQAEEVSQEIFLRIWQRAHLFDPGRGTGTAWILQLAHSLSVDRVRYSQSSRKRDMNYLSTAHVAESDSVLEAVLVNEEYAAVRVALPRLSPKQQESLQLAYFRGMSTRQISELLSIPVPTVKSRLRDGLSRLATFLVEPVPAIAAV